MSMPTTKYIPNSIALNDGHGSLTVTSRQDGAVLVQWMDSPFNRMSGQFHLAGCKEVLRLLDRDDSFAFTMRMGPDMRLRLTSEATTPELPLKAQLIATSSSGSNAEFCFTAASLAALYELLERHVEGHTRPEIALPALAGPCFGL